MPRKTESNQAGEDQVHLPAGVVPKPPISLEDLKRDAEYDPQGAEGSRRVAL